MKDFGVEERCENRKLKERKKWKSINQTHREKVEEMKAKREESYNKKRNELLTEYMKKEKEIEKQLELTKKSKEKERQKNLKILITKENQAREKYRLRIESEEKDRLKIEKETFARCKHI